MLLELLKVHLGDQTDSKMLLGAYICQAEPGKFKWQPGILTTAVSEGRWILIEDIDLAPVEVISVLLPLLESRHLFIPSRGEKIVAKDSFRLFATRTKFGSNSSSHISDNHSSSWLKIEVDSLSKSEIIEIIEHKYPLLKQCIPLIIRSFECISKYFESNHYIRRYLTNRDLFKWCHRVQSLWVSNNNQSFSSDVEHLSTQPNEISLICKEDLFREATSCFTDMLDRKSIRESAITVLGNNLDIPHNRIEFYLEHFTPAISIDERFVSVGRASVPVLQVSNFSKFVEKKKNNYALTTSSLKLLETLTVCAALKENVLLVGETGTGKTTTVQHLSNSSKRNLVVLNMSQQTESSDLLGGFKPVDSAMIVKPMLDMHEQLFARTFSIDSNAKFLDVIRNAFRKKKWDVVKIGFSNSLKMAQKVLGIGLSPSASSEADKPIVCKN